MSAALHIPLHTTPEQRERLVALQRAFAQACNALAPLVQQQRCWNRVALHHLGYRQLRAAFPALGSQMACNAIYSVCRAARLVYQHPASPFQVARLGERALPLLRFADSCPVYFDRHTLSVRKGRLSLFTLDGRMHFDLALQPADEQRFHQSKLRELVLARRGDGEFQLSFWLDAAAPEATSDAAPSAALTAPAPASAASSAATASATGAAAAHASAPTTLPSPSAAPAPLWPEFVLIDTEATAS